MTNRRALPPGDERLPPNDLDAEQAVLGSALLEPEAIGVASTIVRAEDFYREAHQQVFAAMTTLAAGPGAVDLITVTAELRRQGLLENCGGGQYLIGLMNETPTAGMVAVYADIVREKSVLRQAIAFGANVQEQATANPEDASAFLAETVTAALSLADQGGQSQTASVAEGWEEEAVALHAAINEPYGVTAARSGIPMLDKATGGYGGMYLIVMMSDQKAGKTSFGIQTALSSAIQFAQQEELVRQRVLVMPLEEGRQSWVRLAACWLGGLNSELSLIGRCPERDKAEASERIAEGHGQLRELPITIANGVKTPEDAVAAIQVEHQKGDLGLIVVDYLQKLKTQGDERQALGATAEAFQSVSEETNTPLLLSSQSTWNAETGRVQTYGGRGATFEASLVMSLRRDVDEKKRKKDTGVIRCEDARGIREFGEVAYRVSYSEGGHYYGIERPEEEAVYAPGGEEEGQNGPQQTW